MRCKYSDICFRSFIYPADKKNNNNSWNYSCNDNNNYATSQGTPTNIITEVMIITTIPLVRVLLLIL